jgi:hypothetical protein
MNAPAEDHGLEFLLTFNGRIHHLEKGYWLKFEIGRVQATPDRPYAFKDAATLIDDFFDEVERVLTERGVSLRVIGEEESERLK